MRIKKSETPQPEKKKIADKILMALLYGIMVPAILTSPFGLYAIVVGGARYYFRKSDFHREAKRLQKRGYVSLTKTEKGFILKLLDKGRKRLWAVEMQNLRLQKHKFWDGKWHLYIFDIPEEHRTARDLLRRKLKLLGMYNIQRSTFIYPYDCREELSLVSEYYDVGKFTLYAKIDDIDLDKELQKRFKL